MSKIENLSCSDIAGPTVDFGFGFNDPIFSNLVLHIEVIDDSSVSNGDSTPNRKKSKENDLTEDNIDVQVKSLHVNSLVLAASCPFFYKLFKNGMRESQERDVTLRISASEESALMDILKFIYSNTLSATTTPDLLDVLIAADKYQVTSCMRYCSSLLQKVPMSLESALSYLELPSSILLCEVVQPLIVAAKEYLVARFSDFNKFEDEVMVLPLCAVEVILGTSGLQVDSEDDVFDFILEWASTHYPKLEERRKILTEHLLQCIHFRYMSCSKLKEVLVCPDFGHEEVSKLVLEALFLKAEFPYTQDFHGSKERIYNNRPVKVVPIEFSQPRCVVFFDLRKEECENLFQSSQLYSQSFSLGGRCFYLLVECCTEEQPDSFGLFMHMTKESESCTLDHEFAVMKKSSKEFQAIRKDNFSNSELLQGIGYPNLLNIPWVEFMKKDGEYFIDGILHLRFDLTLNSSEA